MNVRTIGISLLSIALAGFAPCQETKKEDQPAPAGKPASAPAGPRVSFETSMGTFVLELNPTDAPLTTKNFLSYVEEGFYNGIIFHRVIPNFMIQGGGFELVDGMGTQKKTKAPIKNEGKNGLKNLRGAISMARTNAPDTATTQFFINVVDNPGLDPKDPVTNPRGYTPDGYAVFGKVVEGMDVIDKIKAAETGVKKLKARHPSGQLIEQPMQNVPLEVVVIRKASLVKAK